MDVRTRVIILAKLATSHAKRNQVSILPSYKIFSKIHLQTNKLKKQ